MKAWHFIRKDRLLDHGDGRVVVPGETLRHEGRLELCRAGLHGSMRPLDALDYAPGPIVCRVELGGEIVRGGAKVVASERTVLWMADATDVLRKFARLCALDVVHRWGPPEVVLQYLHTGDPKIRYAAMVAARDAVMGAVWAAARDAASGAMWAATRSAAWAAARDAAREAARAAAWGTAWEAAREEQNTYLTRLLNGLCPKAQQVEGLGLEDAAPTEEPKA